jgi:Sec-independent protein secretion pathway component TatC
MFPVMFQFISRNSSHMKVKDWINLESMFELSIELVFESQVAFKIEYLYI